MKKNEVFMLLYYFIWQVKLFFVVRKHHQKNSFDFIHHLSWGSFVYSSILGILKTKFILGPVGGGNFHNKNYKKYYGSSYKKEVIRKVFTYLNLLFSPFTYFSIKKAHKILVVNEETKNIIIKNYRGLENKIYIGNDIYIIDSKYELQLDKLVLLPKKVLWLGRYFPRKGTLLIPEVINRLRDRPYKWVLLGKGTDKQKVLERITQLELNAIVEFHDEVNFSDVSDFYRQSHVLIFPSLRENGGAQILEAYSHGLPVIALNHQGPKAYINESTGFLCSALNPNESIIEMADAIDRILSDEELYKSLQRGAFEAHHKFTAKYAVDRYLKEIYD